jgi:putative glutamine amidotransferase
MTRPVLGVSCCDRAFGGERAQVVINRYVEAAMKFADVAVLLIPALPELMSAREVASRLDGILLTGSPSNVEPWRYGEPGAADIAGPFDPGRDAMTFGLIAAMTDLGRPVFGVCRGFEEINVAFGGTLRRDAGANPSLLSHHAPDGVSLDDLFAHAHEVSLAPGGILARAFDRDRLNVNSVHFQAVGQLGDGLTAEAVAPDGLVEAVSGRAGGAPVLAVQWHPEWRAGDNSQSQTFFRLLGRALRGEPL